MPVPLARPVSLTSDDDARLESLVRAHSTPQALALRCRLLLRIAAPDQPSNVQVATEMDCERHTVGRWRQRYLAHGHQAVFHLWPDLPLMLISTLVAVAGW